MRWRACVFTTIVACGGGLPSLGVDAGPNDAVAEADAPSDAGQSACNPASPFGAPVAVKGASLGMGFEYAPTLTADELGMYWTSTISDASQQVHIFFGTRTSITAPFGPGTLIGVNGTTNDSDPALTADGLTLYFQTDRDDSKGDVYVAYRTNKLSDFTSASPVGTVNNGQTDDTQPAPDVDGSLWYATDLNGTGSLDIFHASSDGDGGFSPAEATALNSSADDWSPTLSADGLQIFFASKRAGGAGNDDIYVAKRPNVGNSFGVPIPVTELETKDSEIPHWISPDGCRLYLARSTGVTYAIYVAARGK